MHPTIQTHRKSQQQIATGRSFMLLLPTASAAWSQRPLKNLCSTPGVTWSTLDTCRFGICDLGTAMPIKQNITVLHNMPADSLTLLFKRCNHTKEKHHKESQNVYSKLHTTPFCATLSQCIKGFLMPTEQPPISHMTWTNSKKN